MQGALRHVAFLRTDLPVFVAILITLSAVLSLFTIIAIYREGGILKRLRATPVRPPTILLVELHERRGSTPRTQRPRGDATTQSRKASGRISGTDPVPDPRECRRQAARQVPPGGSGYTGMSRSSYRQLAA